MADLAGIVKILGADAAKAARDALYRRLAGSLDHLCEVYRGLAAPACARLLRHSEVLRSGQAVKPEFFAHYFVLLRAIEDDPDSRETLRLLRRLSLFGDIANRKAMAVRPLAGGEFSPAGERRLRAAFASESLHTRQIARLTDAKARAARQELEAAIALLKKHAPQSFGEFRLIAGEIVPVDGRLRHGMYFDGCSSVERWGAILLNMAVKKPLLERAETLIHEAAHSLLFALSPDDRRVLNDPEERYASPLRLDRRPIDGIYHATFVLARMIYAMREVAASPSAPAKMRREAQALVERRQASFREGHAILKKHAKFTPLGRRIAKDAARLALA